MTSYGSVAAEDSSTPLLEEQRPRSEQKADDRAEWRVQLGEILENEKVHLTIVGMTLLDATLVLFQIIYTFFHECQMGGSPSPWVQSLIEAADVISQLVTCIFLMELTLALVAFGPQYFLPGWPHWKFHVLDLVVVIATFVFDIVLHGKEREVAELLIIFRLWRVVRIVEAAVLSMSYANQETVENINDELEELKSAYAKIEKQLEDETQKRLELQNQLDQLRSEQ
ncbi:hypothetical protein BDB00DRAFT_801613 [Zychaea mexicana]|uniref:uncharacterized protein n=1 Tax=Zychaea mexicana TaxID=64656 RepID=UPI0022FE7822|nr:uncharacterized protein BDB00DRAFT_801613 [Zychaea mexicana]KAI9498211.1 hypothetical protein BDB00DRAFT_801613 [Zychaea mexicana]